MDIIVSQKNKAQLGSGFYSTKDRRQEPDLKVIAGLTYKKAYGGFNFRYMNGTRRFGDIDAVTQNWQLAFQYGVQQTTISCGRMRLSSLDQSR